MPRVHWTGFGKFHGVADNPSATLAERVAAKFADDSWEVVEVSGEAARDAALNGATPTSSSTSASPWTTRTSRSSAAPTTTRPAQAGPRRRADLGMSAGKIAAQCAHASLGGYREALRRTPDVADRWVGAGETVIVVQHDGCLRSLHAAAVAANLNTSLIADAGRTEVAPGTETVLGVGPAPADDVDAITGRLKLLS
ncbi:peptidyl-tRNA hydrolase [Aureococcus anophagefferens]|nr:peptidyl-tRNA hydrolase [Aureococcus anophagefferens]